LVDGEVGLSMPEMRNFRRKICLLGDAAVGKTSLIRRFVEDMFDDKYVVTLGTKVTMKELNIEVPDPKQPMKITLMIWDILGQKELKRLQTGFYRGASGALIVAEITRKETLDSTDDWIQSLFNIVGTVPVLLLLNKRDLDEQVAVKQENFVDLAKKYETTYLLTSAKTGENVDIAFKRLSEMIIPNYGKGKAPVNESKALEKNHSDSSEKKVPQKPRISKSLEGKNSI
jgi:small GTP-binding protein